VGKGALDGDRIVALNKNRQALEQIWVRCWVPNLYVPITQ